MITVEKWLKIVRGNLTVVNQRRINTMAKRKRNQRQIIVHKSLHRKTPKAGPHELHYKPEVNLGAQK